jgi:coenzyme F420-dependent glucose-6-phosphate dehydrogenase
MRFGLKLCSEERTASELLMDAARAEAAGFDFAAISDHFHPWVDAQGESPFVWTVLGGIAAVTEKLEVGTAVSCPTVRMHPAIVAQATATAAAMLEGRFFFGVGTGEWLNEHVTGARWPRPEERRAMLREAIDVIRDLWSGELVDHAGPHYRVEGARLYSTPDSPPPIMVAAGGPAAARLAAEIGDGMIGTSPDREVVSAFRDGASPGARIYAEMGVCWSSDPEEGLRTAIERWPNAGLPGSLSTELAMPAHFEEAASLVGADELKGSVVVGADVEPYVERAREYADAGYDGLWFHQIGTDQDGFCGFAEKELLPALSSSP